MALMPTIKRTTAAYRRCWSSVVHMLTRKQFGTFTKCDAVVVGGGIAGASCSYRLARTHKMNVICLEKEQNVGCHSTGKSFGIFAESNARSVESKLMTVASRPFFECPDDECCDDGDDGDYFDQSVLNPSGLLAISSPEDYSFLLDEFKPPHSTYTGHHSQVLPMSEATDLVPFLRRDELSEHAIHDTSACNFNTQLVYDHFLVGSYNVGVQYYFNQNVVEITKHNNGNWDIQCYNAETQRIDRFEAGLLLNCAGAWADQIADKAGVKPIGLLSQQRSVIVFTYQNGIDKEHQTPWIGWISPTTGEVFHCCFQGNNGVFLYDTYQEMGETAEMDLVLHRLNTCTTLNVQKIARKCGGAKCSTPNDRNIVIGPTADEASFSWCAALGSYGLQLAPAYSEITSYLALNKQIPQQYIDLGIDINKLLPSRLPQEAVSTK
eukprot:311578_1